MLCARFAFASKAKTFSNFRCCVGPPINGFESNKFRGNNLAGRRHSSVSPFAGGSNVQSVANELCKSVNSAPFGGGQTYTNPIPNASDASDISIECWHSRALTEWHLFELGSFAGRWTYVQFAHSILASGEIKAASLFPPIPISEWQRLLTFAQCNIHLTPREGTEHTDSFHSSIRFSPISSLRLDSVFVVMWWWWIIETTEINFSRASLSDLISEINWIPHWILRFIFISLPSCILITSRLPVPPC